MVEAMLKMMGVVTGSLINFFSNLMPGYVLFIVVIFIALLPITIGRMIKRIILEAYNE